MSKKLPELRRTKRPEPGQSRPAPADPVAATGSGGAGQSPADPDHAPKEPKPSPAKKLAPATKEGAATAKTVKPAQPAVAKSKTSRRPSATELKPAAEIVKITVRTTNGAARRRRQAKGIVAEYAAWSTAFGLLPIPFADMAGISATQVSMVAELSKFYNVPFSRHWIRTILGAIAGGVAPWGVTTGVVSLLKSMPGLGVGIRLAGMAGLSNLATRALGNLFISHFENGGDLSNVDTAAMRTALNGDLK